MVLSSRNRKKKFIVSAATASLVVSTFTPSISFANEVDKNVIKDMNEKDFGYKEIAALQSKGIIDGFPDGTFRPHQLLKREEATKLLMAALKKSGDGNLPNFSDVKKESVWMPYVDAAVDHEIMLGHRNGKYGFGDHLTREQMASILVRAFNLKPTKENIVFTDLSNSSPSHKQDILILAQNGITFGFKDGSFKPKESVNRVDFSVFLARALKLELEDSGLTEIDANKIVYNGKVYLFDEQYKGIFQEMNESALKNALIDFVAKDNQITSINSISLDSTQNVKLDLGKQVYNGELIIKAPEVSIANGEINGKLSITSAGNVSIIGTKITQLTMINTTKQISITQSTINELQLEGMNSTTVIDESSSVKSAEIMNNATVTYNVKLVDKLIVGEEVTSLTYNGNVSTLELQGTTKRTIQGLKSLKEIKVPTNTNAKDLIINFTDLEKLLLPNSTGGGGVFVPTQPDTTAPLQVQEVVAEMGNGKVDLAWKSNSEIDMARYEIYYLQGSNVTKESIGATKKSIPVSQSGQVSTSISTLTNETPYAFIVYAVDLAGNYSLATSVVVATPSATKTITTNIFQSGISYESNYIIEPTQLDLTFGSSTTGNVATVDGNVTVKKDATLENLKVNGTVFLDPGDNGEVTLTNVEANKIEILSGKKGTVTLNHVTSQSVLVSDDNGIRISTDGNSQLGNIELAPTSSSSESEIQFQGNFNQSQLIVSKPVTLTAMEGFSAGTIEISTQDSNAIVKFKNESDNVSTITWPEVNINSSASIETGSADVNVSTINVKTMNSNDIVSLSGNFGTPNVTVQNETKLNVNAPINKITTSANITLSGTQVGNIQEIETNPTDENQNIIVSGGSEEVTNLLVAKKNESIASAKLGINDVINYPSIDSAAMQRIIQVEAQIRTAKSLGAVTEDFKEGNVNLLTKFNEHKISLDGKIDAIRLLNEALNELPSIEVLEGYKGAQLASLIEKVKKAKDAIDAAKDAELNPSTETNIENYSRFTAAEAKIIVLEEILTEALQLAISLIDALPEVSTITYSNVSEVQIKVTEANQAKLAAQTAGAVVEDFESVSNLEAINHKVESIKIEQINVLELANTAIANIPIEAITSTNLVQVKELVDLAVKAAEDAEAKAVIIDRSKIDGTITKIADFESAIELLVEKANADLSALPDPNKLTVMNMSDATTKLEAAKSSVEAAISGGIGTDQLIGLERIEKLDAAIEIFNSNKSALIETVNHMLSSLPEPSDINEGNVDSVKALISTTVAKIMEAKSFGAKDEDLVLLDRLMVAKQRVSDLESQNQWVPKDPLVILKQVNDNPGLIKHEDMISITQTYYNEKLHEEIKNELINYNATNDGELSLGEVRAILEIFLERNRNEALIKINANPNSYTSDDLIAVLYWMDEVDEANFESYTTELEKYFINSHYVNYSNIWEVIYTVNKSEELELLFFDLSNASINGLRTLLYDLYSESNTVNLHYVLLEEYQSKLSELSIINNQPTKEEIAEVIRQVNSYSLNVALTKIHENLSGLTSKDLSILAESIVADSLVEAAKSAIQEKLKNKPGINQDDIKEILKEAQLSDRINQINNKQNIIGNLEILLMESFYIRNYENYISEINKYIEDGNTFTIHSLRSLIHSTNEIILNNGIDRLNENPLEISFDELKYVIYNNQVNGLIMNKYYDAFEIIHAQNRTLSRAEWSQVVEQVNKDYLLLQINEHPEMTKEDDLYRLLDHESVLSSKMYSYISDLISWKTQTGKITLQDLQHIIGNINRSVELEILNSINNGNSFNEEELTILNSRGWYNPQLLMKYQEAVAKWLEANDDLLTKEMFTNIILDITEKAEEDRQSELLLKVNETPNQLTFEELQNWGYQPVEIYHQDYIDEIVSLRNEEVMLTKEHLSQLIKGINLKHFLEKVGTDTFNISIDELKRNLHWYNLQDKYYSAYINELSKLSNSSSIDIQEVSQAINRVNEEKLLDMINSNPSKITYVDLIYANQYYVHEDLMSKYRANFIELLKNGEFKSLAAITVAITSVNDAANEVILKKLNEAPLSITSNELRQVSNHYVNENRLTLYQEAYLKVKADNNNRSLTVDDIVQAIISVNLSEDKKSMEIANTYINKNLSTFTFKDLHDAGFPGLETYLIDIQVFRDALKLEVNALKRSLSLEELSNLIYEKVNELEESNRERIVQKINTKPAELKFDEIQKLSHVATTSYFEEYKNKLVTMKNDGVVQSQQSVDHLVREINQKLFLEKVAKDAKEISLQELRNNINASYVNDKIYNAYISELFKLTGQSAISLQEINQVIDRVNIEHLIELVQSNPSAVTYEDLFALSGVSINYEYNNRYRSALVELANSDEEITVESIKATITNVNDTVIEDIRLKLNGDPLSITFDELNQIVNRYMLESRMGLYRNALQLAKETNEDLSIEIIAQIVEQVNIEEERRKQEIALEYINQNPTLFTFEDLQKAQIYYYAELGIEIQEYRNAINSEIQEMGRDLSIQELQDICWNVIRNYEQQVSQSALETINTDPSGLTKGHLIQVLGSYYIVEGSLSLYKTEIISHKKIHGEILEDDLRKLIYQVNRTQALNKLNDNLSTVTEKDFEFLFMYSEVRYNWDYIELYRSKLQEILETIHLLALKDVHEILKSVNQTEAFNKIVANPNQIDFGLLDDAGATDINSDYIADYIKVIESYREKDQLTIEIIPQIVNEVNQGNRLKTIQDNPYTFNLSELALLFDDRNYKFVIGEFEEEYREKISTAVKSKELLGELLTLEEVRLVIETVLAEKLSVISNNIDDLTIEDLGVFFKSTLRYENLPYYQIKVREKVEQNQGILTRDDLVKSVTDGDILAEQERLAKINLGADSYTRLDLELLINDYNLLTYDYFEFYQAAIEQMKLEKETDLSIDDVLQAIHIGNENVENQVISPLDRINGDPNVMTLEDVVAALPTNFSWTIDESNFERYKMKIIDVFNENNFVGLSQEQFNQTAYNVGLELMLEYITNNANVVTLNDLEKIIGATILNEAKLEKYKLALLEKIDSLEEGHALSLPLILEAIQTVNSESEVDLEKDLLQKIHEQPSEITADDLISLSPGLVVYEYYLNRYRLDLDGKFTEIPTLADVLEVINETTANIELGMQALTRIKDYPQDVNFADIEWLRILDSSIIIDSSKEQLYKIVFEEYALKDITITLEGVINSINLVNALPTSYFVYSSAKTSSTNGEMHLETNKNIVTNSIYFVSVTNAQSYSKSELEGMVSQGMAFNHTDFVQKENNLTLSNINVPKGEYVAYAVSSDDKVSYHSNGVYLFLDEIPSSGTGPEMKNPMNTIMDLGISNNTTDGHEILKMTLSDSDANIDNNALDTVTVKVENSEGNTISVVMNETGIATGVFSSSVTLGVETDEEAKILKAGNLKSYLVTYEDAKNIDEIKQIFTFSVTDATLQ